MSDAGAELRDEVRYKAGDVCRMADVQPYVLRYWESEFSVLAPERGAPGPRLYTPRDVKIIERIKKLLYDEGYTIAGAKKRLEGELKGDGVSASQVTAPTVITVAPAPPPLPEPVRAAAPRVEVSALELSPPADAIQDVAIAPEAAPEPKSRRRTRSIAPPPVESAAPALFEVEKPAPAEEPASAPPSLELAPPPKARVVVAAAPPARDARVDHAIAELKEILALLSGEPD
jgi:DNA-binding transcriptional MerR regulator